MNSYRIAVVGATGAVGQEILRTLERRNFPVAHLKPLASSRSLGKTVEFQGKKLPVEELRAEAFSNIDYALFSAGATRSREFAPACKMAGAVMIDNSSAFRMNSEVPLVVPEINAGDLQYHRGIISVPNCSAIILGVPLWPLHQAAHIERIIVSTYQSASGAGAQAMAELEAQSRAHATGQPLKKEVFPHQIAFNVFSHNTAIAENGYNEEENKVIEETRKIFHEPNLPIVATCIRVPVLRAHSESIVIETRRDLSPEEAREILSHAPGVKVVDNREKNHFPMPLEATGQFDVLVGRIRRDLSHPRGLALFVSGDQLLKGAAWNAVQILEHLTGEKLTAMAHSQSIVIAAVLVGFVLGLSPAFAFGPKRYHEGETERGYASWYGADFQGKLTADGERFDRSQLTAAHRHLPFGTIVRVTNRSNGASVDVCINDRGPWEDGRIIDVSEAAADILQMKRSGTIPVEIEVIRLGSPGRANSG